MKLFLSKGVRVVFSDYNEKNGLAVQSELHQLGLDAHFVPVNVTNDASIAACITKAAEILGVIDIAVNTAGVTGPQLEGHVLPETEYRKIFDVDMDGCWRFSKAIIPYFRAQEPRLLRHDVGPAWEPVMQRGSLVNVASSIGSLGQYNLAAYCEPFPLFLVS